MIIVAEFGRPSHPVVMFANEFSCQITATRTIPIPEEFSGVVDSKRWRSCLRSAATLSL
jgi:hypothetical protein